MAQDAGYKVITENSLNRLYGSLTDLLRDQKHLMRQVQRGMAITNTDLLILLD